MECDVFVVKSRLVVDCYVFVVFDDEWVGKVNFIIYFELNNLWTVSGERFLECFFVCVGQVVNMDYLVILVID